MREQFITAQGLLLGIQIIEALPHPFKEESNKRDMEQLLEKTGIGAAMVQMRNNNETRDWTSCKVLINEWPTQKYPGNEIGLLQAIGYAEARHDQMTRKRLNEEEATIQVVAQFSNRHLYVNDEGDYQTADSIDLIHVWENGIEGVRVERLGRETEPGLIDESGKKTGVTSEEEE